LEDITVRTHTSDGLTWQDGTLDGGMPVLDYRINIRVSGVGEYVEKASSIATQSHTVSDLVLGTTYDFTVESRNDVGYGPAS
jgi:hypothetical protein